VSLVTLPSSPSAPLRYASVIPVQESRRQLRRETEIDQMVASRTETRIAAFVGHGVLALLAFVAVFPILWMYVSSLHPPNQVLSAPLFSSTFSLGNYSTVLDQLAISRLMFNTTVMAVAVTFGQLLSGLFVAYAFARWSFRGERVIFFLIVATWLVPFQVTMLPNYVELSHLGFLNSLPGVIIPQLASPLAVLMLRQHLKAFPTELLDAARVDGQSSFATLWRVVVPNIAPSLAALAILLFVSQWNEYFWPLLVYHQPVSVLQLAIQNFLSVEATNYGALMAASGLACLPIFVLYIVLQRRVVNAFVRSGLR
jgi:ABC-type glycerol-3-phosphate transport system permease component